METGRINKSKKNFFIGIFSQIIIMFLTFINRTTFIKILGVEFLGINGLFSDILSMLSLADLGISTAMVFSYYKPLADNNEEKLLQLTNFYKKIYTSIAFAVLIVGLLCIPFLKYLVNTDTKIDHLHVYYILLLFNTACSYLFVYKAALITADQKNYLVSTSQVMSTIIKTIFQICFLFIMRKYAVYLFVQIIATLINNIMISFIADRHYAFLKHTVQYPVKTKDVTDIVANIKSMMIYKVATVLLTSTDNTLISVLVGTASVGLYSNYNLAVTSVNTFINIFYQSVTPSVGNVIVTEEETKRYQIFNLMQSFSLILTVFSTLMFWLLLDDLIYVWLGSSYRLDKLTVLALVLNYYLGGVTHPILSYREAAGLYRETKYIMLICAGINLGLSILLGKIIGLSGILFASGLSRLMTNFWFEPKILFNKYFKTSSKSYFIRITKNFLLTIIAGLIFTNLFAKFRVTNWKYTILKSAIVGMVVLGISVLPYINDAKILCRKFLSSRSLRKQGA